MAEGGEGPLTPEQAFGRVLRDARRAKALSQEALADASGCHRTYVSLLERGRNSPSLSMLFDLAGALGTTPAELLLKVQAAAVRTGRGS
jgi:transcriptional regulator with XRE-family HTH domain